MSWTSVKTDGRGGLEFRFAIEGLPYQFVTSTDMEQTTGGQEWLACMKRDGIGWSESCQVPFSEIEGSGPTIQLVDRLDDDAVTQALAQKPAGTTYLSVDATATAATLNVLSTAGILAGTYVHIGTEAILVDTVQDTTKLTVTRAQWDTTAQKHYTGDGDALSDAAVYIDRPRSIEGRRCYLYAYGDGDTLTGTGTEIFRGVMLQDAQTDGVTWTLQTDTILHLLNQDLGADIPEATVRGIYYSWLNPLIVTIAETSDTTWTGATNTSTTVTITGFYEDQSTLCAAINDALDLTPFSNAYTVEPHNDVWRFSVTTPAASPKGFRVYGLSAVDNIHGTAITQGIQTVDGAVVNPGVAVAVSTTYYAGPNYTAIPQPEGACTVPRGYWGAYLDLSSPSAVTADISTAPINRIYISGGFTVADVDGEPVLVDWADDDADATIETVDSVNAAARWVALPVLGNPPHAYTKALLPRLSFPLGFGASGVGLTGLKDAILSAAPTFANIGRVPFITSSDLGDWDTAIAAAEGSSSILSQRRYLRVAGVTLGEYLTPEFRMRALFPTLDSLGRIRLKQIRLPVTGEPTDHTIVNDDVLWGDGPPEWERIAMGSVDTSVLFLRYDPVEDDWDEPPIEVRNVSGRSERKQPRTMEIKPYSFAVSPPDNVSAAAELGALLATVPGTFASDYATLTFDVHLGKWDVLCGDTVSMTISHVPNPETGRRGITNKAGLVIGRSPQLDNGRIRLTVLYTLQKAAGYAPTVGIASQATNGASSWIVDVVKTAPGAFTALTLMESADNFSDHFEAGMNVEIWEFATASPTKVTATVESVDDTNSQVTLTSVDAWTPSTKDWVLKFQDALQIDRDVDGQDEQDRYAFFGTSAGKVEFADADADAYEYTS